MSTIRIIHTADNHLGLQFANRRYRESVRRDLVNERFDALERIVAVATDTRAHFLVIAGDLFDSVGVTSKVIDRAATVLRAFGGLHLVILPGNHDFYESGEMKLWGKFQKAIGDHAHFLLSHSEPLHVSVEDREVIFYPGPCTSKTSSENAIRWVSAVQKETTALHIGIAHGCVRGISPDTEDRYYQMSENELRQAGVDFWLLGHTHTRFPREPQKGGSLFFFPSTHTPDGFDCNHEGYVWALEIDDSKQMKMESIRTGKFRFHTWSRVLDTAGDLERIEGECVNLSGASTLLKLSLDGRCSEEELERIDAFRSRLEEKLAHCELHTDGLALKIDREYVEKHFSHGSLPYQLLLAFARPGGDDLTLHLAYELVQEAKR